MVRACVNILNNIDDLFSKILLSCIVGAGKSTLMAALRGKLNLLDGERIENDQLR